MTERCPVCQTEVAADVSVCPVCGFKLLGATVEFKPLAFNEQGELETHDEHREGVLKIVRGPRTGVEYRLGNDPIKMGRNPKCNIFLNDMTVSRLHATIEKVDGCYIIHDQNSFNGVWVNNVNVGTKVLEPGDYVQIGAFCFKYEERDADGTAVR